MRKTISVFLSILVATLVISSCTSDLTGDTYSRDEARRPQSVRLGTIETLRPVKIEGTKTIVGGGAGAVAGGLAGSSIGGGKGRGVMAVIGAVAGGLLGSAAEEGLTRTQGVEITVREDGNDSLRAYVQEVEEGEVFKVGDRIRIVSTNGKTRVTH
ncbi:UNVERIFIED_CONTAM: hypothetical protein GTU68_005055 [Idotea baltica]|nr:hypothetical protein [Idotea baltica]